MLKTFGGEKKGTYICKTGKEHTAFLMSEQW